MLEDGEIVTVVITVSTLSYLWTLMDDILQKRYHMGREDSENILSLGHAIVTLQLMDSNLKHLDPATFNPTNKSKLLEELGMIFSCSYFLYDTFRWKFRGPASKIMLCHHICSIFAIVNNLAGKCWGTHGNMALLVLEGSNPLLHLRRILIGEGLQSNKLIYKITEWAFLLSFIFFRFGLGVQYVIFIRYSNAPNYLVKTAYMLFAISSVFLVRIVIILKAKILAVLEGNDQKISHTPCSKHLDHIKPIQ
ncbi:hypothetical protein GE061_019601 [Apolygus lucorum]|uniref:Uncharacterized protein n=1 Tax=Apolygus lucorum TaxID=248454 RepID=A0A6A4JWS6_APOLU|nr:hypothetical protein GE061_019601 [Apolygus lucorum]